MPGSFSFSTDTLVTNEFLFPGVLTRGAGPGVNNPAQFSAISQLGAIDFDGDVDVLAITLVAGQTYTFDIDDGAGDAEGVDVQLDLIDFRGNLVTSSDDGGVTDNGSVSGLDPLLNFTATQTGIYYVAVHQYQNDYNNGDFSFGTSVAGTGDYSLVVSTPTLPPRTVLTTGADTQTFDGSAQNILALGGADILNLGGGNDIADGQGGADRIFGEAGDDQVNGGAGRDRLDGGVGDDALTGGDLGDVLIGGLDDDALSGGNDNDNLNGGTGNDTVWGDSGADTILGGSGADFIRGGEGIDDMRGGLGADTFHFLVGEAQYDTGGFVEDEINDFSGVGREGDVIDLSDIFDGTLTFIGSAAFTGAAGEVRFEDFRDANGDGYQEVRVNLDADAGTVELAILVDYVPNDTLLAGDFIL